MLIAALPESLSTAGSQVLMIERIYTTDRP
jgi:hypothetical protein